jgi:hypothetical protein
MAVMAQIGHGVAFAYPQAGKSVGEPVNALAKLSIAETPTLADDSHFLREEFLSPPQEHEGSQGNNHGLVFSEHDIAKDIRGRGTLPPKMADHPGEGEAPAEPCRSKR